MVFRVTIFDDLGILRYFAFSDFKLKNKIISKIVKMTIDKKRELRNELNTEPNEDFVRKKEGDF